MTAVVAGGGAVAAAATVGPVAGASVGSGDVVVAACDSDGVALGFAPRSGPTGFEVADVSVAGIDAGCAGRNMMVSVSDEHGATLATGSLVVASDTETVHVSPVDADHVARVSVVITG